VRKVNVCEISWNKIGEKEKKDFRKSLLILLIKSAILHSFNLRLLLLAVICHENKKFCVFTNRILRNIRA